MKQSQKGTFAELLASTYLMEKGFQVFRALAPCAECDLIVIKDQKIMRVEVKTVKNHFKDKFYIPKVYDSSRFDLLILINADKDVSSMMASEYMEYCSKNTCKVQGCSSAAHHQSVCLYHLGKVFDFKR